MYKIKINKRRRDGKGRLFVEFEFKDRDICELAYSNLYCSIGGIPIYSEIFMYRNGKKIKSFIP